MHGGMKIYRGSAAAARNYVEADRSRADDYYLAEGSGLAQRLVARPGDVQRREDMDGATYEQWVAGYDVDEPGGRRGGCATTTRRCGSSRSPSTGRRRGRSRPRCTRRSRRRTTRPRIVPRPRSSAGWPSTRPPGSVRGAGRCRCRSRRSRLPSSATSPRAPAIRTGTSTSRSTPGSGLPGAWRGLHTVGVRDSLEAINGIGHAAVMTDPGFRAALAAHGYSLDDESGEVVELAAYAGAFSARARQIETNIDRYEAEWRGEHPGEEPGPALRQSWDRRAWSDARPDKVVPVSGEDLRQRWVEELGDLGFVAPSRPRQVAACPAGGAGPGRGGRDRAHAARLPTLGVEPRRRTR